MRLVSDQPNVPVAWEDLEGVPQGGVDGLHDGDLLLLGVAPSHLDQNARHRLTPARLGGEDSTMRGGGCGGGRRGGGVRVRPDAYRPNEASAVVASAALGAAIRSATAPSGCRRSRETS